MAKIAFFELEDWEGPILREKFPNDELTFLKEPLTEEYMSDRNDYEIISVFVHSKITAPVIEKYPNLKLITTRSTGFDHFDLAALKAKNIAAAYVPGYGDNTVAEYTFGLMLSLTRKIVFAVNRVKENSSFDLTGLRGMDIKGKTLGVVGTGRIGREVIKIGKGFGMNVVATAPHTDPALANELGFSYVDLEALLSTSDVVTLHCPLTTETRHLINVDNIKKMKKGAYLINTARGGLIETEALVLALNEGILGGVGLDVLEEEGEIVDELSFMSHSHPKEEELRTLVQNHVLMHMPNVIISPHNAFNTKEALTRILQTTIESIMAFKNGAPTNLVPNEN